MDGWTGGHTDAGPCWACPWDSASVTLCFALDLSPRATCYSTSLWPPGSFHAVGGVTEWVSGRDRGLSRAVQGRAMTEGGKGRPARWRPGERADAREPGDVPARGHCTASPGAAASAADTRSQGRFASFLHPRQAAGTKTPPRWPALTSAQTGPGSAAHARARDGLALLGEDLP